MKKAGSNTACMNIQNALGAIKPRHPSSASAFIRPQRTKRPANAGEEPHSHDRPPCAAGFPVHALRYKHFRQTTLCLSVISAQAKKYPRMIESAMRPPRSAPRLHPLAAHEAPGEEPPSHDRPPCAAGFPARIFCTAACKAAPRFPSRRQKVLPLCKRSRPLRFPARALADEAYAPPSRSRFSRVMAVGMGSRASSSGAAPRRSDSFGSDSALKRNAVICQILCVNT